MQMIARNILFAFIFLLSLSTYSAYLPPAHGQEGMVVSAQKLASLAGLKILKEGGNAIDAAVAIGYALAVVHPCCGNLGGGGFMLIHRANGKNIFINFRERAPAHISAKLFFNKNGRLNKKKAYQGYLPVGIPGTVMGLNTALKKFGTLSLAKVMAPAIKLAKEGFILTSSEVRFLKQEDSYFKQYPNVATIFLNHGVPYQVGQRLVQKNLAHTLIAISKQGSSVFYRGWIAKEIVKASREHGGVLTLEDFSQYHVKIEKPIYCQYRGYQIITAAPPSSGVIVCEILSILKGYPMPDFGFHSAKSVHYNLEAMRYAFADRNQYLGDPDFVKNPVKRLLSAAYANKIRSQISPNKAGNSKKIGVTFSMLHERPQTTHYSVADRFGNAVSVTVTLNGYFGSKVIAGNTGFFLNNELMDFTLKKGLPNQFQLIQGKPNFIQPNKQPLSSMSPTIIMKNKKVFMILGAAGGSTIITSIVEAIEHVIDDKMNINAAINQPRYHMQWLPDITYREPFSFSKDTLTKLQKMGYKFQLGSPFGTKTWGQMAAILVDPQAGLFYGANDNRRPGGLAIGY